MANAVFEATGMVKLKNLLLKQYGRKTEELEE
jgi:hypothetical protein